MKTVSIKDPELISKVEEALRAGALVMHPTETCYGLAVDVFNQEALKKLYEVKGMSLEKPVSILVDDLEMAKKYGDFSEKALELAGTYWPGPLSILVPRKRDLPSFLNPSSDFVSFRCSDMGFCSEMVGRFGGPVSTTSANKHTEPQLYFPQAIEGVDLLVDAGKIEENLPSTIVKVDGEGVEVLRQGGVKI